MVKVVKKVKKQKSASIFKNGHFKMSDFQNLKILLKNKKI
jgi:hypothetical protein